METEHAVKKAKKKYQRITEFLVIENAPKSGRGARQKWFKFRALWFWRHVHVCIWREQKHVCPVWREIEGAAATSILDHDIVKSSWKYRLLCCSVTWDVTQSNGLQEGSFIFLFSVSCFDEEVIFFIYFCREIRKEHERTRSRLALRAQYTCSNAPAETPFPGISLLEDLDSSVKMKKKKQFEARCQRLNYTCKTSEGKRPCRTGRNDGWHVDKRALHLSRTGADSLVHVSNSPLSTCNKANGLVSCPTCNSMWHKLSTKLTKTDERKL